MNYVLKYSSGEFVGEDRDSGGYPYPTRYLSCARMFDIKDEAKIYLTRLMYQFPDQKFDPNIFEVSISRV